ncbi:MAG TPA: hypothetical protein VKD23_00895 [Terriglobales bacterium]|jgi:hypothetical protein|nr:hypothetical protein [Terriglobales bacterium]
MLTEISTHAEGEVTLKRAESYTLTVRVRDVDPKTPKIKVTPVFEGSDNYAP